MDWKSLRFYANEHRQNVRINASIYLPRVEVSTTDLNKWRHKPEQNVI